MNQIKTYRFKLKPTKVQAQAFAQWLGSCRYVCNLCLDYKKQLYTNHQVSINKNELQKELSAIAKDVEWTCGNGHVLDRDVNAAINIKNKGVGHTLSAWERYNGSSRVAQESHCL